MLYHLNKIKFPLIIAAGCAILIFGISAYAETQKDSGQVTYRVESHADRALAVDVEGLVQNADYIVIGHYDKYEKNWEISAAPYSEGDIYNFVIEETLMGDLPQNIPVGIPRLKQVSTVIEGQTYAENFTDPNYVDPNFDSRYILFLKKYQPLNLYTPASLPYHIEIDPSNNVTLKYHVGDGPKQVKMNNKEMIEFTNETYDLSNIDNITGTSADSLITSIQSVIEKEK